MNLASNTKSRSGRSPMLARGAVAIWLVPSLALVMLMGCQTEPSQVAKNNSSPQDAKTLAIQAKDALFSRLSGRLTEVMESGGPLAAIAVCSQEAAEIAETVGTEHGVKIGRTSLKLRNQSNQPPQWAARLLDASNSEPKFVQLPDGHTGALLPIMLQSKCVLCHGPQDQIAEPIRDQLDRLYPNDAATGFQEGDLRGWFWVDVPLGLANS